MYAILGVDRSVDARGLKKAYRQKALECHPDKNPNGEQQFKEVNHAYQILSMPKSRAEYDRQLARKEFRPGPTRPDFREPEPGDTVPRRRGFNPTTLNVNDIIKKDREMAKKKANLKQAFGFDPAKSVHLQDLLRKQREEMPDVLRKEPTAAPNFFQPKMPTHQPPSRRPNFDDARSPKARSPKAEGFMRREEALKEAAQREREMLQKRRLEQERKQKEQMAQNSVWMQDELSRMQKLAHQNVEAERFAQQKAKSSRLADLHLSPRERQKEREKAAAEDEAKLAELKAQMQRFKANEGPRQQALDNRVRHTRAERNEWQRRSSTAKGDLLSKLQKEKEMEINALHQEELKRPQNLDAHTAQQQKILTDLDARIRGIKQKMEDQSNEAEKFRQPEPSARGLEEEKMRQMEQLRPLPKKKSPNPQPPAAEMQEFLDYIREQRVQQELAHAKFQAEAAKLENKILNFVSAH